MLAHMHALISRLFRAQELNRLGHASRPATCVATDENLPSMPAQAFKERQITSW